MKGFMHIIEIIITGILFLTALLEFSRFTVNEMDWSRNYLDLAGRDILFSLDKSGAVTDWYNESAYTAALSSMLPPGMRYSIKLAGVLKQNITVAVFSQDDARSLQPLLYSFVMNNRNITFKIAVVDINNVGAIGEDVAVFMSKPSLSADGQSALMSFLENDKGVVEITDLSQGDIDALQTSVFGLQWVGGGLGPGSNDLDIMGKDAKDASYNAQKYFYALPSRVPVAPAAAPGNMVSCTGNYRSGTFTFRSNGYNVWIIDNRSVPAPYAPCTPYAYADKDGNNKIESGEGPYKDGDKFTIPADGKNYNFTLKKVDSTGNAVEMVFGRYYTFSNFVNNNMRLYPADGSGEKAIIAREKTYQLTGNRVPGSIVNHGFTPERGAGRAAWVASGSLGSNDYAALVRSLVVWAAGSDVYVHPDTPRQRSATNTYVLSEDGDIYQAYQVVITLWNIY